MHKLAATAFPIFLCLCSLPARGADDYLLNLRVERNGVDVVDSIVELRPADKVDLLVQDRGEGSLAGDAVAPATDEEASARVVARANESDAAGNVEVDIQYFEKREGNWVLVGEPSIVASLGAEAKVQLASDTTSTGGVQHLEIFVTIRKSAGMSTA